MDTMTLRRMICYTEKRQNAFRVIRQLFTIIILLIGSCSSGSSTTGTTVQFPWVQAHPGLINDDGTTHTVPGPHAVTGVTIDVTQAPYNCSTADSSVDDRPGIESAMAAASAGDELYFPDGVYNLKSAWTSDSKSNIRLKSGVNIRGQSQTGVFLKTDFDDVYTAADPAGTNSYYVIRGYQVNTIYISNITITSSWNRTYSTSTTTNNTAHGGPNICLYLASSSGGSSTYNIYVENVTVEKYVNIGINTGPGCHDVVLKSCTAQNATDLADGGCGYGFQFAGKFVSNGLPTNPNLGTTQDTYFNVMDGCIVNNQYIRHAGLIQYWAHNNIIKNCSFSNTQIDSIDMHGEDEYNNEIANNTVSNCSGESAVGVGNSGGTSVIHDKSGLHNYIHDNTITNCKYGVSVQYNTPYTRIENNTIQSYTGSNGKGFRIGNAPYTILKNNIVQSNSGSSYYGFHFYTDSAMGIEPAGSPTYCTVTGNSVINNSNAQAYRIDAGSNNTFTGNTASGNSNNTLP
jgi:parallel beta-helix repeat protein